MLGSSERTVSLHLYSESSNYGAKKRETACREIEVIRNTSKQIDFVLKTGNDENQLSKAYSLFYRGCPSDKSGSGRYYMGDIVLSTKNLPSPGKEITNISQKSFFKMITPPVFSPQIAIPEILIEFNQAIQTQKNKLWNFIEQSHATILSNPESEGLHNYKKLFLHFDMTKILGVSQWYEKEGILFTMDALELENLKINKAIEYCPQAKSYVLHKLFFHTLTSGDEKNDNQFPEFNMDLKYKSFSLKEEQLRSLFYYFKTLRVCEMRIPKSEPFRFRLIPIGDFGLDEALSYIDQIGVIKKKGLNEDSVGDIALAEETLEYTGDLPDLEETEKSSKGEEIDPTDIMSAIIEECTPKITSFDLILVRQGPKGSATDVNMGEINNLSRSSLQRTLKKLKATVNTVLQKRNSKQSKTTIAKAFYAVHRAIGKGEKFRVKYVRIMLKLYRDVYYGDPELNAIFLETLFKSIRDDGFKYYYYLKTAYEILQALAKKKEDGMSESTQSQELSKDLGHCMARIAWPLCFIMNNFEKSQIGLLTDRIGSLDLVVKLLNSFIGRVRLHIGDRMGPEAGNQLVRLDEAAVSQAFTLIERFGKEGVKYDREYLAIAFSDEYSRKKYYAKPKKEPVSV
jgi:hypothetical protein